MGSLTADQSAKVGHLRSFGRRGRKLSQRQNELLCSKLEQIRIDLNQRFRKDKLPLLFSGNVKEVWLEIGFGAGEHLIWQAENNPEIGVIGAEPYINGVVAALSAIETLRLETRVKIHADDGVPLLDWLPSASISRAFILFPDPWPKTRHRARRIFSVALLNRIARVLSSDAKLRFASDVADYAHEVIEHARGHPEFEIARIFSSENRAAIHDWPVTRYEAKARKAGRLSTFVELCRM